MLVEIILGFIIGCFVAPNKKIGFAIGCVCGVVWAVIQVMLFAEAGRPDMNILFKLILIDGSITGLFALVATHAKMKKKAKSMQVLTKKFD